MRYLNVSYIEARNMPRRYRKWFIDRYVKELTDKKKNLEEAANKNKR